MMKTALKLGSWCLHRTAVDCSNWLILCIASKGHQQSQVSANNGGHVQGYKGAEKFPSPGDITIALLCGTISTTVYGDTVMLVSAISPAEHSCAGNMCSIEIEALYLQA